MAIETVGFRSLKRGDHVVEVEFRCGECGHLFCEPLPLERLNSANKLEILQRKCRDGHYSGFNLGDKRANTVERLNQLCSLLTTENLSCVPEGLPEQIGDVLQDRGLMLRFNVERLT